MSDRDAAEEILQEAFARVWASANTPSTELEFKRWLYRTIMNLARDRARRRQRWSVLRFWLPEPPDPLQEVERRAADAELAQALRALNLRERQAVHLRYFEDQPFVETARLLGTSEPHARVIVHRALRKLRRAMGESIANGVQA